MMRIYLRSALFLLITSSAFAQPSTRIKATSTTRLEDSVYEAVSMGLVKDTMKCDSSGNIFTPANRGYSSAYGAVVKISADGTQFIRFPLDAVAQLRTGHVEDFQVADDQSTYILAREVTKYSELEVPQSFGGAYILKYSPTGQLLSQTRLNVDYTDLRPTTLAVLSAGGYLIGGYANVPDKKIKVFAQIFGTDGRLQKDVSIPASGVQRSNSDLVSSMSVIQPTIVASGKQLFLLQGSTREPVYAFSESGELLRTITLAPSDIEFSSPMVWNGRLVVHQHHKPVPSGTVLFETIPDVFPIFDLGSGAEIEQYAWKQSGELACYRDDQLTIVHNASDPSGDVSWVVFKAKPAFQDSSTREGENYGAISFEVRAVAECEPTAKRVPQTDEETGVTSFYCLAGDRPIINENDVSSAGVREDAFNTPTLKLTLTQEGAEKIHRATLNLVGQELGVTIDGQLVFVAIVKEPIRTEVTISGKFRVETLTNWAERLNALARARQQSQKL